MELKSGRYSKNLTVRCLVWSMNEGLVGPILWACQVLCIFLIIRTATRAKTPILAPSWLALTPKSRSRKGYFTQILDLRLLDNMSPPALHIPAQPLITFALAVGIITFVISYWISIDKGWIYYPWYFLSSSINFSPGEIF